MTSQHIDKHLLAQYHAPLNFVDDQTYRELRNQHLYQALAIIGLGVMGGALLFIMRSAISPISFGQNIADLKAFLIIAGIPLYGLYQLFTTKKAVANVLRWQLVRAHPELQALQKPSMVSRFVNMPLMPSRGIYRAWVITLISVGVSFVLLMILAG